MNQSSPGGHAAAPDPSDEAGKPASHTDKDESSAAGEAKPMGTPTSDRHHTETASTGQGAGADVAKHDHGLAGDKP